MKSLFRYLILVALLLGLLLFQLYQMVESCGGGKGGGGGFGKGMKGKGGGWGKGGKGKGFKKAKAVKSVMHHYHDEPRVKHVRYFEPEVHHRPVVVEHRYHEPHHHQVNRNYHNDYELQRNEPRYYESVERPSIRRELGRALAKTVINKLAESRS